MSARPSNGKAVIDGVPQYTSVSALNSFSACRRQWWFRYVAGLPGKPESAAQKTGQEGHARIEHYLRTGQDVLGPLEKKAHGWFPAPGGDLLIEHPIHDPKGPRIDFGGIPLVGYIDLLDPRNPGVVKIVDWKFRGDVERYGSTIPSLTSLRTDAGRQMLGYAAWARKAFPRAQAAVLAHGQFQTKGRQIFEPVTTQIDLDLAAQVWSKFGADEGPELKEVARTKSYLRVLPNFAACSAYGGCAYQSVCHDAGARLAEGLFPGGISGGVVEAPSGTEATEVEAKTNQEEIQMGLIKKSNPVASTTTPAFVPTAVSTPNGEAAIAPVPVAPPQGILPPDAPPSKPELASKRAEPAAPAPDAPAAAKKRAKRTDVVHPSPSASAPAENAPVRGAQTPGGNYAPEGIRVYFGCSPLGVATKTLHDFMLACEKRLIEKAQLPPAVFDMRVVRTQELGFGQWKAFLAGVVHEAITAEDSNIRLEPGHYLVTEGDDRILCVAEVLCRSLPPGSVVTR
jgi:hypothetical protein